MILCNCFALLYAAGALRNTILAKWIMLRIIPGNWLDQFSEKQGTFNKGQPLLLLLCSRLPWLVVRQARSQAGSQAKSELAEAAWDSSSVSLPWLAHWGFNNAIIPSF